MFSIMSSFQCSKSSFILVFYIDCKKSVDIKILPRDIVNGRINPINKPFFGNGMEKFKFHRP